MRVAIVPAYQAAHSVAQVISDLLAPDLGAFSKVIVVDDGSSDQTAEQAQRAGAEVLVHPHNQGKGAALKTALGRAHSLGIRIVVSVDADGQHAATTARQLADLDAPSNALILGIRNLCQAGAPRPNRISNRIANFFLSGLAGRRFRDTQCGLRRYPVAESLDLNVQDAGYAFESEFLLRAVRARWSIVEEPIDVFYPPESERVSHFHSLRDPAKIVRRVVLTLRDLHGLEAR